MKSAILAALIASSALAAGLSPAAARDYPYCLQGRQYGYPGLCDFQDFGQCMATASGTDSTCRINPRFAFGRPGRPAPPYRGW